VAITQTIVDDFDGSQPASTYRFALEGTDYEIDLSEDNLGKLRGALAPFIAAGRRRPNNTKATRGQRRNSTQPATDRSRNAAIRAWWTDTWDALGLPAPTSHLGPIPARVRDAYHAAHSGAHPHNEPATAHPVHD